MTDEEIQEFADTLYRKSQAKVDDYGGYDEWRSYMDGVDRWIQSKLDEFGDVDPIPLNTMDVSEMSAPEAAFNIWRVIAYNIFEMNENEDGFKQSPSTELMLMSPEITANHRETKPDWCICWEAGPPDWGIAFSNGAGLPVKVVESGWWAKTAESFPRIKGHMQNPDWFLEPYYSFDICFNEN